MFKKLKNFNETKASGINDLSGIFLKDGAHLFTTQIVELCNLLNSSGTFSDACKQAKLKPFLKNVLERIQKSIIQYHLYHLYPKSWRELYINKLWNVSTNKKFCTSFNQDLGKFIQPIFLVLFKWQNI